MYPLSRAMLQILELRKWSEILNIEYLKHRAWIFHDIKFFKYTSETTFSDITVF